MGHHEIATPSILRLAVFVAALPAVPQEAVAQTYPSRPITLGAEVLAGSPADFAKVTAEDTEKWAKVVKFTGIKAEGSAG